MSFRTSYSQNNTYKDCPQAWKYTYVDRLKSPVEGASLFFGSAIDAAVMDMVDGKSEYMTTFYDRMDTSLSFGISKKIFDSPDIVYSYKDYDQDLLDNTKDILQLETWRQELNLQTVGKDVFDCFSIIAKDVRNQYKYPGPLKTKYYNRLSWLSLVRKGELLIQAFQNQFLHKIKKVHSTQHRSQVLLNSQGDLISGFVDLIVEIEGYDKPIIFDLKTSASPYDDQKLELSEQLAIYAAMEGNKYGTDLVGYIVLCKKIPKDIVQSCKVCNHKKTSKHRKCDNIISGSRCNGDWIKTKMVIKEPEVQVMITNKSIQEMSGVLNDVDNIVKSMKNRIVYKNLEKCHSWYGGKCPFFDACHKNDYSKLKSK